MADLAPQIDSFLKAKGSPLAGLGHVFVAAGKKYGVDPRLVVSIAGAESSFGKYTHGQHNAFGWGPGIPFGSWEEAISTVTKGLRTGYLNQGLTTPEKIQAKWAPSHAANDPTGLNSNWTNNVTSFLGELGGSPSSIAKSSSFASAIPSSAPNIPMPELDLSPMVAQNLTGVSPTLGLTRLVDSLANFRPPPSAASAPAAVTPPYAPPVAPKQPAGGKIIGTPYSGTHTLGNWESDNAVDIAMPLGSPIRAVSDGVIGPQFGSLGSDQSRFAGLRLHLNAKDNEYYYAHLSQFAPGIKPGAKVKAGQILGYSGEANGVAHLHFGQERGNPVARWS